MNDGWSDLQWQLWQRERIVMYESDVWESGFLSKYENSCKLIWSFAITVKYERKWFSLVNVDSRRYRWLETTASNAKVTHLPQWYRIYSKGGATEHNYEHVGCNNCRWRQANCKCPGVRGHRPTNDVILVQSETSGPYIHYENRLGNRKIHDVSRNYFHWTEVVDYRVQWQFTAQSSVFK